MKATGKYDLDAPELFLITVVNIFGSGVHDTESILRVLVALGTVLLVDEVFKKKAKDLNMMSMLNIFANQHGDKATCISKEIESILTD
jgi:HJR/Mrr/RecB family endonuclease